MDPTAKDVGIPTSQAASPTVYRGLPYVRESFSSAHFDSTAIELYASPSLSPGLSPSGGPASVAGSADDDDEDDESMSMSQTTAPTTAPPTPHDVRLQDAFVRKPVTRKPVTDPAQLYALPLPPRPDQQQPTRPRIAVSEDEPRSGHGVSKMVQHARASTNSRAWASQDVNSPALSARSVGEVDSPPPQLATTSQISTRSTSMAMQFSSTTGSSTAHTASDQTPEAAWEDDSSALGAESSDANASNPLPRSASRMQTPRRLRQGDARSPSRGGDLKPVRKQRHEDTHTNAPVSRVKASAKPRQSERAKELARLEQAASQLRARIAAEEAEYTPTDSDPPSPPDNVRTPSRSSKDIDGTSHGDAEILALRRQIQALQQRPQPRQRHAHPALGEHIYEDDDDEDGDDYRGGPGSVQNDVPTPRQRRFDAASIRTESSYRRTRHHAEASHSQLLRADDAASARQRSKYRKPSVGRRTPTMHHRYEEPHSIEHSDSYDDEYPPVSSRVSVATSKTSRRRVDPGSQPRPSEIQELSQKIEMLEQMIRGTSFGLEAGLGPQAPQLGAALPRPPSSGRHRSPPGQSHHRPVSQSRQGDSDDDLTDDWGVSRSYRPIVPQDARRPSTASLQNVDASASTSMDGRQGFRTSTSVENLRDSVRRSQHMVAASGLAHSRSVLTRGVEMRRSVSPAATIASAFQFNATPALGPGSSQTDMGYHGQAHQTRRGALRTLFGVGNNNNNSNAHVKFSNGAVGAASPISSPVQAQGALAPDNRSVRSGGAGSSGGGGTVGDHHGGPSSTVLLSFSRKRTERVVIPKVKMKQAAGRGRVYIAPVKE